MDREKVIKAFEFCLMPPSREELENDICSHEDCPYYREYNGGKCVSAVAKDALALLKAQEPMAVHVTAEINYRKIGNCPNCGKTIDSGDYPNYCGHCGQAVKWE